MSDHPILHALATHERAWMSEAELGVDLADLEACERLGLVQRWEPPGCPDRLWCLSGLAAARLGLELIERWERVSRRVFQPRIQRWVVLTAWLEVPRWAPIHVESDDDDDRPPPRSRTPKPWQPLADPAVFGWPGVAIPPPEPVRPRQETAAEYLRDPWSNQPVKLFREHLVTIDARLDRRAKALSRSPSHA